MMISVDIGVGIENRVIAPVAKKRLRDKAIVIIEGMKRGEIEGSDI